MGSLGFEVLGPVRAWRDGREVDLGTPAQRAVLAVLILHDGASLTTAEMVAAVWDEAPRSADGLVRTYVSRLRQALGAGVIDKAGGGYRIVSDLDAVDLRRLERDLAAANRLRESGDLAATARSLRECLRGFGPSPLSGVSGPYLDAERRRLAALRLDVVEECLGLEVRLGATDSVIGELRSLAQRHPTRERLVRTCMVVLHELGRTTEALECYHHTRRVLRSESGMDPGPGLTACYQNLLHHEPVPSADPIAPEPRPVAVGAPGGPGGLPRAAAVFAGRDTECAALVSMPAGSRVCVDGMPGIGKTALVVRAAQRLADQHPDGTVFLDLRGHTDGTEPLSVRDAIDRLLRSVGRALPPDADEADAITQWHQATTGTRLMIVLDNALDTGQVAPLLVDGQNTTFVTSRRRLVTLPVDRVLSLEPIGELAAHDVLESIVGPDRLRTEPVASDELVRWCAGLPLALQLVAVRLRHRTAWRIDDLVNRLKDSAGALASLAADGLDVAAALDVSLESVDPIVRQHLRVLASLPLPDFGLDVVASVMRAGLPVARSQMEDLLDRHLVTQTVHDRYGLHDLLRAHLRSRVEPMTDDALVDRTLADYVGATQIACNTVGTVWRPVRPVVSVADLPNGPQLADRDEATAWLEREVVSVSDVTRLLVERGLASLAWQYVFALGAFCDRTGRSNLLVGPERVALAAAQTAGDRLGTACLNKTVGLAMCMNDRVADGLELAERAAALAGELRSAPDADLDACDWIRSRALELSAAALANLGRLDEAWERLTQAAACVSPPDTSFGAQLDFRRAEIGLYTGRIDEAVEAGLRAAAQSEQAGSQRVAAIALRTVGDAVLSAGDTSTARKHLQRALDHATRVGDRRFQAMTMTSLSEAASLDGDAVLAGRWLERAGEVGGEQFARADRVDTELRRASATLAGGDVAGALRRFQRTADVAAGLDNAWDHARARHGLVRCLRQGNDAAALARAERDLTEVVTRHGLGHPDRRVTGAADGVDVAS